MNRSIKMLLGSTLAFFAFTPAALGGPVEINTSGYRGQWTLDYGDPIRGGAVVGLEAGSHVVSISGAELFFDVAPDGHVTPKSDVSATGGPGSLTFKTMDVYIDSARFQGDWRISRGATPPLSGPQRVKLVRGLRFYSLAVGASGAFGFDIAGDGTVTVHNDLAATGGLRRLRFNSTEKYEIKRALRATRQ